MRNINLEPNLKQNLVDSMQSSHRLSRGALGLISEAVTAGVPRVTIERTLFSASIDAKDRGVAPNGKITARALHNLRVQEIPQAMRGRILEGKTDTLKD